MRFRLIHLFSLIILFVGISPVFSMMPFRPDFGLMEDDALCRSDFSDESDQSDDLYAKLHKFLEDDAQEKELSDTSSQASDAESVISDADTIILDARDVEVGEVISTESDGCSDSESVHSSDGDRQELLLQQLASSQDHSGEQQNSDPETPELRKGFFETYKVYLGLTAAGTVVTGSSAYAWHTYSKACTKKARKTGKPVQKTVKGFLNYLAGSKE